MPANNYTELFDFEGQLEGAFKDWLAAKSLSADTSGEAIVLTEDYIGATVQIGAATEHAHEISFGVFEYDQYQFTLSLEIHTRRDNETNSSTTGVDQRHREVVAQVRRWLTASQAGGSSNLNTHLPYNEIQHLRPDETAYSPQSPDYDITTLNYVGQFSIIPDAWPT